ncbi:HKD family nuclease [Desulfohalotomaculum tongense]|uniref:phospholipase D-like domain-containing protein n=1 Tax=Desulforadius tongensis TaxID=1216062 RepID=UPI00195862B1|nr:phospholipase D-like domain-containing protein [Desulforadius tongensis]MBM7854315.1 HKD family nuclease [Desulforadius tongensis]
MSVNLAMAFRSRPKLLQRLSGIILYLGGEKKNCFTVGEILRYFNEGDDPLIYTFVLELKRKGIIDIVKDHVSSDQIAYRLKNKLELLRNVSEAEVIINNLGELEDRLIPDNRYVLMGNIPDDYRCIRRIRVAEVLPIFSELHCIISNAEEELIILNPFFDRYAVQELKNALIYSMQRGVKVRIITRYLTGERRDNMEALEPFLIEVKKKDLRSRIKLYLYQSKNESEGNFFDFHAKMIIADKGKVAYLGSANLTEYGLGNRLELGVKIEGGNVKILHDLVNYLLKSGYVRSIDSF